MHDERKRKVISRAISMIEKGFCRSVASVRPPAVEAGPFELLLPRCLTSDIIVNQLENIRGMTREHKSM